jgi:hypothetical protein
MLAAFAVGCAPRQTAASGDSTPLAVERESLGTLKITSARLGALSMFPSVCRAGAREFFLGADFEDPAAGTVLRLAVDPVSGPALRLFPKTAPFERNVLFRRSECRTFQFSLDATAWRVGTVQDYRVALEVDCTNTSGESITGSVAATHCH